MPANINIIDNRPPVPTHVRKTNTGGWVVYEDTGSVRTLVSEHGTRKAAREASKAL